MTTAQGFIGLLSGFRLRLREGSLRLWSSAYGELSGSAVSQQKCGCIIKSQKPPTPQPKAVGNGADRRRRHGQ